MTLKCSRGCRHSKLFLLRPEVFAGSFEEEDDDLEEDTAAAAAAADADADADADDTDDDINIPDLSAACRSCCRRAISCCAKAKRSSLDLKHVTRAGERLAQGTCRCRSARRSARCCRRSLSSWVVERWCGFDKNM